MSAPAGAKPGILSESLMWVAAIQALGYHLLPLKDTHRKTDLKWTVAGTESRHADMGSGHSKQ